MRSLDMVAAPTRRRIVRTRELSNGYRTILAHRYQVLALAVLGVACPSASALTINTTFTASVTGLSNAAAVQNAFNYAATQFQNLYSDPITLNISVASTSTIGALDGSSTSLEGFYS